MGVIPVLDELRCLTSVLDDFGGEVANVPHSLRPAGTERFPRVASVSEHARNALA